MWPLCFIFACFHICFQYFFNSSTFFSSWSFKLSDGYISSLVLTFHFPTVNIESPLNLLPTSLVCFFLISPKGRFYLFIIKIFIYLAVPSLSCGMWDLGSSMFVEALEFFSCGLWDLVSWPGLEPRPPALGVQSLSHWTTREVPVLFYPFLFLGGFLSFVSGLCI